MTPPLEQARQFFLAGIADFEGGRLPAARDAFIQALALAPGRQSIIVNLAATHFRLSDFVAARELLHQALSEEPNNRDLLTQLGLSEEALGNWAAAGRALTRGLQSNQNAELWLRCSHCHGRAGQLPAALAAIDHALSLSADNAEAWSTRGGLLRELGRHHEAAESYRKALALGGNSELNRYYLASVSGETQPRNPPNAYVKTLFDDYAPDFQEHLLGSLRYQGHRLLTEPLLRAGQRYPVAVDLGCGTGLCGEQLLPLVDHIDGIDLSGAMLEQARARGIYRQLEQGELNTLLSARQDPADLFIAADVFSYVGDIDNCFSAVRRLMRPGGCFAFTVEQLSGDGDFVLQPCLRYRHSEDYIRRLADKHGFSVRDITIHPLRYDQDQPIPALYVYLV